MSRRIDPSCGEPIELFLVPVSVHNWCNKGRGMCYPVCGMVHIKEPLLLIVKSSLCGGSGFPFSLSEWSLTICLTPYNGKQNVLSASLNKTFPSFLRHQHTHLANQELSSQSVTKPLLVFSEALITSQTCLWKMTQQPIWLRKHDVFFLNRYLSITNGKKVS